MLFKGSNLISDGSELLLLVPSLKGIYFINLLLVMMFVVKPKASSVALFFQSLELSLMVPLFCFPLWVTMPRIRYFFPSASNSFQVAVGVGALAGSTIMLLTVPWILSVAAGRVELDERGDPQYTRRVWSSRLS